MVSMRRVVVTGLGVLSAIGMDRESLVKSLKEGVCGIDEIRSFDTEDLNVKLAAEIRDFDPLAYGLDKKAVRRMDRYCQFALAAARQAAQDAREDARADLDPFRVGSIVGSGIGGFDTFDSEHRKFIEKGPGRISPFFIPMMISNMAAGMVAMEFGVKGDNFAVVTACASGAHAIGEAFRKIKYGVLDACFAGGAEAAVNKMAIGAFSNMTALSKSTDKARASIPFDKERDGFVLGEGAGILFLEEYEHARRRGAHIYAELVGYGATGDAYHITSPDPDGAGAARAMKNAVEESGAAFDEIDYVNAHGTSTGPNDRCETLALKSVFGEHAKEMMVSSTKSMTGHLLGAAGAVEGAICALALERGFVPPTIGYRVPDEECDLDYVTEGVRERPIRFALSNSLGFGGQNASLLFRKYED